MTDYKTSSPILFLIFNRPDTTAQVFNEIRKTRPSRLYIAADGPRKDRADDQVLCLETLQVAAQIDWECDVKTLYRSTNLGCKNAISSAIDWFFEQEEEGIILEDDCLPSNSFFYYCDTMLERYRTDTRIRHISGCNLMLGDKRGNDSIFFVNQTHVWGWASWKRVWKDYDKDLIMYQLEEVHTQLSNIFSTPMLVTMWVNIFKDLKAGKIDTWDYQLAFLNFFNNGLSVMPNVNLISNIGFRADATHTVNSNNKYSNIPLEEFSEVTYPKYTLPDKEADYAVLNREFDLEERIRKHNLLRRRFKRWIKSQFKKTSRS
ncbi:nucleotide-diphospho-sugar transferase [Pedobacter cryoconitis]|uniref:Nucleotide-diphospho-sugar transferase n=1 Tax=Pedobacter cryoconitis TaxID=188932 RepID=A0A327S9H2_9SPHI|nr:nucleotide-diphospho-sugar transferase [Pedobacter cryoconitis]RAJ25581.1 hypothetical protein LY11_04085 [Pedobacter cryoconitis]